MFFATITIAATMCLQGGEQVDISRHVSPTAGVLELKVTLGPANGVLVVYSPGYEEQQVHFSQEHSFGWIAFVEPILCVKAIGGPFEFDIDVIPMQDRE